MAFSLKNLGQRLLDSTTIDEKASQFFRPKTGTLATAGRQWAQELAARPLTQNQQKVAEVPIAAMRGVTSALTGFTGLENKIAPKLGLGTFTSIKPQYAPGKVAEVAGAIGGSLIPAAPINQLARLIKPVGAVRTAQKYLGSQAGKLIAQKGLTGIGGRALANVSQGIPFTAGFALAQKIGGQQYGGKQLAGDVGFDAAAGALIPGAAATLPLLMGITKNKADLSKVLKNEAGVMALIKRMSVLDKMGTAGYQQTKAMVQKAVDVLAPDLAKNRELNKLKDGINADEWMKTVTNVLQDRLVAAKTGDYTLAGMSTRAMGKIDTPKLSVEPTKPWENRYDRKVNDLIESYAKGEEQATKLNDMPRDFQENPKEAERLTKMAADIETGNRSVVKQIAEKLGISEYEAIDALSTYIDAGKRRGGRTVEDFYKWLPEQPTSKPLSVEPTGGNLQQKKSEFQALVSKMETEKARLNKIDPNRQVTTMGDNLLDSKDYNRMQELGGEIARLEDSARGINSTTDIKEIVQLKRSLRQKGIPFNEKASKQELQSLLSPSKPLSVEPVGGITDSANQFLSSVRAKFPDNNEKEMFDYAKKIADIRGSKQIDTQDIAEAVQYSRKVKGLGEDVGFNSLFSKDRTGTEILDRMKEVGVKNIDTSIYNVRDQVKNKLISLDKDTQSFVEAIAKKEGLVDVDGRISKKGLEILNNIIPGGKPTIQDIAKKMDTYKKVVSPSPLGGKVGEAPTIKGIISQRPTGQVATQTPSELSLRQPSLPSQPNRPFLQTTQPQQPPQTPKLQMGSQKMPSTPEAQLDQWKYSSLDRLYTEGIDRFNPLSKVAKLAGRDKDMARQLARYYGTGSIADYHLTEELSPILKSVDINDLKKSAIAMRDVELASRGVKGSPEQVKAQANLQDLTNKLGQEKMTQLGESLKQLYAYQDSMVKKYLVDTGIMSQDSYSAMRKNNQFYVPFKRVMDDVDEMLGVPVKRGAGSVGKQNVIFGIKGSDKEIVDPIESIVENTYKLVSLGERQKTAKVIASLGEQLPGLIKKVATGDSKNTVGLFENGKKVFYEVPVEVADAARGMSEESLNTLIKILKLPTDVFRTMTTGANPEFLLPNVSRDLQTAWFNAGVNPIEWIAGIAHYVKGDQVYKDFLRSGGRTSIISANKEAITRTAQDLATNKGFSIKSPKDLWKGFEILGQFSEQPTRIASFKKIYDKAIKSGLSPEEALQDAAIAAQDTTINFARRGSKTQSINAVYAYLNARMQGVDKMLRTIKNEPGKAAARFGIGLLAPSLALYAWNNRFQSYYDPSVVSDRDKTDNFIFMLSDKRGGMQYLKIPKAEVGKIVNPVEEFLDFARGKDANMANSIKSLLTSFLPIDYIGGLVPTAIQPPLENAINKDLYTGYDLVPQYKKNYPKGYQDSPYTSPVYRMIGQKTGQSPAKLQNLVEGYLGGMSKGAEMITRPLIPQKYVSPKNEQGADINKTFILRRFAGGEKKSAADQAKANQAKNESLQTQINTITKQKLLGNFDSDVADKEIAKLEKQMSTEKSIEPKTNSNYYQFINNSGDLETIDIRQPIAEPKLTGQTEIDKKLKSSYKGKITSRINDIVKLVDAGQLDAKKAESMIKELQVKSAKMSGGKKPKVINIKVSKRPSVKFKLGAARPTLKISAPTTKKSRLSLRNYKVGKIRV